MITLGDEVEDVLTGVTGYVIGHARYLHKEDEWEVQSQSEGNAIPACGWLYEGQLRVIGRMSDEKLMFLRGAGSVTTKR